MFLFFIAIEPTGTKRVQQRVHISTKVYEKLISFPLRFLW